MQASENRPLRLSVNESNQNLVMNSCETSNGKLTLPSPKKTDEDSNQEEETNTTPLHAERRGGSELLDIGVVHAAAEIESNG